MQKETVHAFLRDAGLRMTPLKTSIVDLFLSGGCGLSSGEVFSHVGEGFDQSSVYRCLESLVKAGFLRHGQGNRGVVLYRCETGFYPDHGHFLCSRCGETIPVENFLAADAIREIEMNYRVKIKAVDFTLEGKCENCLKLL